MSEPSTIFISAGEASGEALRRTAHRGFETPSGANGRQRRLLRHGRTAHGRRPGWSASSALKIWPSWASPRSFAICPASTANSAGSRPPIRDAPAQRGRAHRFPRHPLQAWRGVPPSGIPVIFFVSPQLWAWKKHRIKLVQQYVDKMLVIFPFEEPFYREQGKWKPSSSDTPWPTCPSPASGSRTIRPSATASTRPSCGSASCRAAAPKRFATTSRNARRRVRCFTSVAPKGQLLVLEFVLPLAPTLKIRSGNGAGVLRSTPPGLPVRLVDRRPRRFAACTGFDRGQRNCHSGSSPDRQSLRRGLPGFSRDLPNAKRVVDVPFVAMANLIAGKLVVPELIQSTFTAANIVQQIEPLLPDGAPRESMMKELARIRGLLNPRQQPRGTTRECDQQGSNDYSGAVEFILAGPRNRANLNRAPKQIPIPMAMIWNDMHLRVLTMKLDFGFRRLRVGLGMLAAGFLLAGPLVAQRTERSTLDITGYVIDAEIDTTTHHLQAKAIVSFNPPENAEMVSFGFHPALKITKIHDDAGKILTGERSADGTIRVTPAAPFVKGQPHPLGL